MNELRAYYRNHSTVKFAKGEIIFHQGETPKCLYAIKSGIVQVTNLTDGGDCRSISFEMVDDIIPACWAFSKTTKSLFYYGAHTNCELYIMDKKCFLHQLSDNAEFANKLTSRIMNSYIGSQLQVDALEKPNANQKLMYTFRYLTLLYGRPTAIENFIKIQIPLTQQVIANFIGLTRETVSIELSKMESEKIVTSRRKMYTIDIHKLNEAIDDDYSLGVNVNKLQMYS